MHSKPIIVVIERQDQGYPNGQPVVTEMRRMTLVESWWFNFKGHVFQRRKTSPAFVNGTPLSSVGIKMTNACYNTVMGSDNTKDNASAVAELKLMPPAEAYPSAFEGNYSV